MPTRAAQMCPSLLGVKLRVFRRCCMWYFSTTIQGKNPTQTANRMKRNRFAAIMLHVVFLRKAQNKQRAKINVWQFIRLFIRWATDTMNFIFGIYYFAGLTKTEKNKREIIQTKTVCNNIFNDKCCVNHNVMGRIRILTSSARTRIRCCSGEASENERYCQPFVTSQLHNL